MKPLASILFVVLSAACLARSPQSGATAALAVGNRFLCAWQNRDAAKGLPLVSARLRKAVGDKDLRQWIVGLSNPHNAAFEIGSPRFVKRDRTAFTVRLYFEYTAHPSPSRPRPTQMVMVRLPSGEWRIDQIP